MIGKGTAFGAATVVNAMPSGFGAAFGVALKTTAEVELTDVLGIVEVEISGSPGEDKLLAAEAFRVVMEHFGLKHGARIRTNSEIPIARGMKSSSAASNAVVLATLDALNRNLDDLDIIRMGVEASVRARVTLTGAFDDACASFLGGLQVTDNRRREILKSSGFEPLGVIFLVPESKRYSGNVDAFHMAGYERASKLALSDALDGRYWQAMLLNGLLMAHAFKADPEPILAAMRNGAISAGLCGKGPAIVAISSMENQEIVAEGWEKYNCRIMMTQSNSSRAGKGDLT
ncbi:MAG: shikimate kinase [Candidatus Methanomethylicus sp.]|nr:shikimate kinase [Candidatus Methanomethylicus sp.]